MEMVITFSGGAKVDAQLGEFTIRTDQPPTGGGEGSAPAPFSLFLASLGTCAGIYVLSFCRKRDLRTDGIRIVQKNGFDHETHKLTDVTLTIEVPKDFPEKYYDALIRAADQCAVKRAIMDPPKFEIGVKAVKPQEA
jgi:putative redox protein